MIGLTPVSQKGLSTNRTRVVDKATLEGLEYRSMVKYNGVEIYAVCTLGEWFGMIYKDGTLVYETLGYIQRNTAISMAKVISHNF